jgi:hypothetical protein
MAFPGTVRRPGGTSGSSSTLTVSRPGKPLVATAATPKHPSAAGLAYLFGDKR